MLEDLKEKVYQANLELVKQNLVMYTWGNASGIDREKGLIVIKPSGVSYENMQASDMVVVDFRGNIIDGKLKPSSDTLTHIELYKNFKDIGGIVHTHSKWATQWAQAKREIPAYGTTQADYFYENIPCTRELTKNEVDSDYERNTGNVIVETFKDKDYMATPGILCGGHGPFAWGKNPMNAVYHASVLERCAEMAYFTEQISGKKEQIPKYLSDRHYFRKHGKNAYYGQNNDTLN